METLSAAQRLSALRNVAQLTAGTFYDRSLGNGQVLRTLVPGDALGTHVTVEKYFQRCASALKKCIAASRGSPDPAWSAETTRLLIFSEPAHLLHLIKMINDDGGRGLEAFADLYLLLLHRYCHHAMQHVTWTGCLPG